MVRSCAGGCYGWWVGIGVRENGEKLSRDGSKIYFFANLVSCCARDCGKVLFRNGLWACWGGGGARFCVGERIGTRENVVVGPVGHYCAFCELGTG